MSVRRAFLVPLLLSVPVLAWAADAAHPTVIAISEVQGTGLQSPMLGQRVTVEGIPQYAGDPTQTRVGMYLHSATFDSKSQGSRSIYVVLPPAAALPKVNVIARVTGTVSEIGPAPNSMTALVDVHIEPQGPAPKRGGFFPPRMIDEQGFESFEGHSATYVVTVLSSDHLFDRGELQVSLEGRLYTPTEVASPGTAAGHIAEFNARRMVTIDDSLDPQAPASQWYLRWPMSNRVPYRTGMPYFVNGVLVQSGGRYRLIPSGQMSLATHQANYSERKPAPDVEGNTRIASLNVLNLFNGDGKQGGFPTPRGAETYAKYQLQQAKIIASVQALMPDVAALMEVENDGTGPESALAQFVEALNAAGPIKDYRFVDSGKGPGTNPIRFPLIKRKTRLAAGGSFKTP